MIYCSVKYCCSNSSIPGVILHSIMKSIKTPNHPAYHWSTLWHLEVWVRGLYKSWWFAYISYLCLFIYHGTALSGYHMIIHTLQTGTPLVQETFRIGYIRDNCTSDKIFLCKWSTVFKACIILWWAGCVSYSISYSFMVIVLIFQTMNFCVTSIDQNLKYYSFTPSGCQDIEFRKFEIVVDKNSFVVDEKNQVL